jgi:predicted flap endonuclease-1-like 5' DNA nuclease
MGYLAIQMSVFLSIAMFAGTITGWWIARFIYRQYAVECRTELAGLRRNYDNAARENASLRSKLRQLEQVLHKIGTPPSDTDYGKFLQLRKALEKARGQYEGLLGQCHQQEQSLARLSRELQASRQELVGLRAEMPTRQAATLESTTWAANESPGVGKHDDLTRIQGINQRLASKLQALGIVTYRQVAEFTSDDVHNIQRIIGTEIYQPPEEWVQNARSLFQQKYSQLQA